MRDGIAGLQTCIDEWLSTKAMEEVNWSRMRALEFQEILQSRDILAKRLEDRACVLCADFNNHVRLEDTYLDR